METDANENTRRDNFAAYLTFCETAFATSPVIDPILDALANLRDTREATTPGGFMFAGLSGGIEAIEGFLLNKFGDAVLR